jgi:hypothetical protein
VCGQHHAPAAFTPGKDPVPIVHEARWAPEPVWTGAENLASPGFDPQTFQPVASRYTDYAIPGPGGILVLFINITRLASNEIFLPSNKIHREVGRAKDLSAPLYILPKEYLYLLYVSQEKQSKFSLYNPQRPTFITEEASVYCAVRPGPLNRMDCFVLRWLMMKK